MATSRLVLVISLVVIIASCSGISGKSVEISKQFGVCIVSNSDVIAQIRHPVDVEFAEVRIDGDVVKFAFDNYPRRKDISEEVENNSPIVVVALNIRVIERGRKDGKDYIYLRFDQIEGSKYPYAYAEVMAVNDMDNDLLGFVEMMRRCS